ncbi:MAG: cell division protein FtsX [Gaiellales bacterium]|jgi:cell division transport system permease protein|nr:permease-like cell division protein FtsX [Gaiellales bacterium]
MRWRFFVGEAMHSIRGNVATTLAASITVLIVTLLLGVFAAIFLFVRDRTDAVKNDVTVKAYVPKALQSDQATLSRVRNELAAIPNVKSIEYVSPDDAIKQLSKEEQANIAVLGYNPLPPAFYMKLADPNQVDEAKAAALQIPEVRNCGDKNPESCVTYGEQITKRVLFAVKVILIGVGSVMLLLGIAAVVLIANTIRLSIFSRRREIEVMKLVGATNWFVRVPFILEGMLTGILGALGGVLVLAAVYTALKRINSGLAEPANLFPGGVIALAFALAAFGAVLGAFGSGMTLRRFLKV